MRYFDPKQIAVVSREGAGMVLEPNKTIVISTEILDRSDDSTLPSIVVTPKEAGESRLDLCAQKIEISSIDSPLTEGELFSVTYGERVVEVLRWLIQTMMTHTHGPNTPALPDFHTKANEYLLSMEDYLLNKNVRTR